MHGITKHSIAKKPISLFNVLTTKGGQLCFCDNAQQCSTMLVEFKSSVLTFDELQFSNIDIKVYF